MKNLIRVIAVLLTAVFLCFNIYYELAPGITVAPEQKFVFAAIFAVLLRAALFCGCLLYTSRLPFSFSKRSPVSGLRRAKKQRETGVKRVETAGVYPFAPAAWVRRPQRAAKFVMFLCFRLCLFRNSVILIAFVKYRKEMCIRDRIYTVRLCFTHSQPISEEEEAGRASGSSCAKY